MNRLQRSSWWGLVAMAAIVVPFGVGDVLSGVEADPAIAVGLTGLTPAQVPRQHRPRAQGHRGATQSPAAEPPRSARR